jgi:hypothetical protein
MEGAARHRKTRTRWHRVRIARYQLPKLPDPARVNHAGESSGFGVFGSAHREKGRTILSFTIFVGPGRAAKQQRARLAYHFEGTAPPGCFSPPRALARPSRQYRNPIALAQEWQCLLASGECPSQADLARTLGVRYESRQVV